MPISERRMDHLVRQYEQHNEARRAANVRLAAVKARDPKYAPKRT
jgi:hypothetical protein